MRLTSPATRNVRSPGAKLSRLNRLLKRAVLLRFPHKHICLIKELASKL